MRKRFFSLALGALLFALCVSAQAQQAKKIPTVGFLLAGLPLPLFLTRPHRGIPKGPA